MAKLSKQGSLGTADSLPESGHSDTSFLRSDSAVSMLLEPSLSSGSPLVGWLRSSTGGPAYASSKSSSAAYTGFGTEAARSF